MEKQIKNKKYSKNRKNKKIFKNKKNKKYLKNRKNKKRKIDIPIYFIRSESDWSNH